MALKARRTKIGLDTIREHTGMRQRFAARPAGSIFPDTPWREALTYIVEDVDCVPRIACMHHVKGHKTISGSSVCMEPMCLCKTKASSKRNWATSGAG